jgi:hypothetical protein
MHVNQAVKRNLDKFPEGYIIGLTKSEKEEVITNCDNPRIKFSPALPNAFTEKGLYMLATILKSEKATDTTIAIVEAFAKMRELANTVAQLVQSPDDLQKQAAVTQKSGEILSDKHDWGRNNMIGVEHDWVVSVHWTFSFRNPSFHLLFNGVFDFYSRKEVKFIACFRASGF